jgi:cell division protein FtsB
MSIALDQKVVAQGHQLLELQARVTALEAQIRELLAAQNYGPNTLKLKRG